MAIYTEVDDEALTEFVDEYDIGSVVSYKGIAEGAENSNYLLETDRGPFILTLYEKRVDPNDLPFFLNLMHHHARTGIKCPIPVTARDGEALRALAGRPAAIITFLQGAWPRRITPAHCTGAGRAMADMHRSGESFSETRRNSLSLREWRPLFNSVSEQADEIAMGVGAEISAELDYLESEWPQSLPSGVIHADLFPDNVFFLNDEISGLIDFYFACTDFLAYDIAIGLNAWCFETDTAMDVTRARNLLAGYEEVRALSNDEKKMLPTLARGAAMRFLLTRLYDWVNTPGGVPVKPKDPAEYLHKLRFHQGVSGNGAYGLT